MGILLERIKKELLDEFFESGWVKGRYFSDDFKKNVSNSSRNKLSKEEVEKRKNVIMSIGKSKRGWQKMVSNEIGCTVQAVKSFIKKYMK